MPTDLAAPVLLYVEDELLIQYMLVTALEEAGFRALLADRGSQALELFAEESKDLHGLISDVTLGDGPDGWEVARTARELATGLPVVYVSAASELEWTSRAFPTA